MEKMSISARRTWTAVACREVWHIYQGTAGPAGVGKNRPSTPIWRLYGLVTGFVRASLTSLSNINQAQKSWHHVHAGCSAAFVQNGFAPLSISPCSLAKHGVRLKERNWLDSVKTMWHSTHIGCCARLWQTEGAVSRPLRQHDACSKDHG
eukprot:1161325-Pelagomonas_calceolata.AAC.28